MGSAVVVVSVTVVFVSSLVVITGMHSSSASGLCMSASVRHRTACIGFYLDMKEPLRIMIRTLTVCRQMRCVFGYPVAAMACCILVVVVRHMRLVCVRGHVMVCMELCT